MELVCHVNDLKSTLLEHGPPIRMYCAGNTEVTIAFKYSDVYDRAGAKELWESHTLGTIYNVPVIADSIPKGKIKLIYDN